MIEQRAYTLVKLKKEFARVYDGVSQIQEVISKSRSDTFPISDSHLQLLHRFADENPICHDSFETQINTVDCVVYGETLTDTGLIAYSIIQARHHSLRHG